MYTGAGEPALALLESHVPSLDGAIHALKFK
jgi:hypothetical protein